MTREELRDYVEKQRELGNLPYHVYSTLIDEIDTLEQEPTTKNNLEVDCIPRIEVIDYLCKHCPDDGECFKDCDEIKHLRQMPSVTPQEPKTGYLSIDDAMSVFDDFMCGEVDEEGTETFLEMLKDKAESEVEE